MTRTWSREERLKALASFLPTFTDPTFKFGEWRGGEVMDNDVITMPFYSLSPDAARFHKVLYEYGFIRNFDWIAWAQTDECKVMRAVPSALDNVSEDQLARLLTGLARAERFSEGVMDEAFSSGLLTRIVARASTLIQE
jgi:hypothetical protein